MTTKRTSMMNYNPTKIQQGDVDIRKLTSMPSDAKVDKNKTDNCLAYGEVTGHAHRISSGVVEFLKMGTQTFLRVKEEAALSHEEHKTIILPPGDYQYGGTQEFDYDTEEARRVAD